MSTHPYIPLYVDDFEAATAHLTPEEDGIYNRLIRLTWRTPGCSLPVDPTWIARKIRVPASDYERIAGPILEEFFTVFRGRWIQRRLTDEYDAISRKQEARKNAGKKGGKAKALKTHAEQPSNATVLPADTRAFQSQSHTQKEEAADDKREREPDAPPDRQSLNELEARLVEAAGAALASKAVATKLFDLSPILGLLKAGTGPPCDLEADVVPAIMAVAARSRPASISSWAYFVKAIAEHRDRRLSGAPAQNLMVTTDGQSQPARLSPKLEAKRANLERAFRGSEVAAARRAEQL